MKTATLENQLRRFEIFHKDQVPPNTWIIIRVDGRGFSKFTEQMGFNKPFDLTMHNMMTDTATLLMGELDGIYAYTESDEISILFPPEWNIFDRKLEKLVSISAGIASAGFSAMVGRGNYAVFDGRVWMGINKEFVVDYFRWRQADAWRCCLNSYVHHLMLSDGISPRQAASNMNKVSAAMKVRWLTNRGIDISKVPGWQKFGTHLSWSFFNKEGYNPKTKQTVVALRKTIVVDSDLPKGNDYAAKIYTVLKHYKKDKAITLRDSQPKALTLYKPDNVNEHV